MPDQASNGMTRENAEPQQLSTPDAGLAPLTVLTERPIQDGADGTNQNAPATCTRQWYATWTGCRCESCLRLNRRVRKAAELGIINRVSSDEAWAALDRMAAKGWSCTAIASACGISPDSIKLALWQDRAGHRRRFTAKIAAKIVEHGEPTAGTIDATGARRKLEALAWLGHDREAIAAAAGFETQRVTAIRRGRTRTVGPRVAAQVDRAWRSLADTIGTSELARAQAIRCGWAPPAAWDDIDDPTERPKGVVKAVAA